MKTHDAVLAVELAELLVHDMVIKRQCMCLENLQLIHILYVAQF